jgi:Rieske Fe-S protein
MHALYWDTEDPYHYVRLERSKEIGCDELLIVGGEDHRTGQADDGAERYLRLEAWARNRFPSMRGVEFRWSGEVQEPADGVAFIGRNPGDHPNVYIATGDSGMGMTHGTIAGILLSDLILGREHSWAKLYDPARKPTGAPVEYARENMSTAAQYVDWVKPAEVKSVDDVPVGTGRIVQRGLSKIAVFRDEQGRVTERSAVCPHLQCIVQWNSAEQTWDCPCHGSRFKCNGAVINGPANCDLGPA